MKLYRIKKISQIVLCCAFLFLWGVSSTNAEVKASMNFSSYLGGYGEDVINDITADQEGNIYIVGQTGSPNFPVTPGAYDVSYNGGEYDIFVAKINPNKEIVCCTFIGGSNQDRGYAIKLDQNGFIYIVGLTFSNNFPTVSPAYSTQLGGGRDAVVCKLSPDFSTLVASTYLGGGGWDYGFYMDLDQYENVYVSGFTHGGFPTTPGSFQPIAGGGTDGYVAKLNSSLSQMLYGTYVGRRNNESLGSIAVDAEGNCYIAAGDNTGDFPTTSGVWDRTPDGEDAVLLKLNPEGGLVFSTLLGGSGYDWIHSISLDDEGNIYVAGQTSSSNFPLTENACQATYGGGERDTFITVFNNTASQLLYSTYLGGNKGEWPRKLLIDDKNNITVYGYTASTNFPLAGAPLQLSLQGAQDAYVARINPENPSLVYASYWGGTGTEFTNDYSQCRAMVQDKEGRLWFSGCTSSQDFPISSDAWQEYYQGGSYDGFVSSVSIVLNNKPIAIAGDDRIIEATGEKTAITLDGSQSYDPDPGDEIESYKWLDVFDQVIAEEKIVTFDLGLGEYTYRLIVNDGEADSDIIIDDSENDSLVKMTLIDLTPPEVNAGDDIIIEANTQGGAIVTLPNPVIHDTVDPNPVVTISGMLPVFPVGTTVITVMAEDASGNIGKDEICVIVKDTTPPNAEISASPNMLWPPNHTMREIQVTITKSDVCDSNPTVVLNSITCNEPAQGDIKGALFGTEDYQFWLRAERKGNGDGRVYTIEYTITDLYGNSTIKTVNVTVPHDMRKKHRSLKHFLRGFFRICKK